MKKLVFILISVLCALTVNVNAQRGKVQTLAVDTIKGNNNKAFSNITVTGTYQSLMIEATCNKISAAAGGTFYLQSGLNTTNYQTVNESNSYAKFFTNDTLTITDGAIWRIEIPEPAAMTYRLWADGDANDTVKVTIRYVLK